MATEFFSVIYSLVTFEYCPIKFCCHLTSFFISHNQDFCHVLSGRNMTPQYVLKWILFPSFLQVITEDLGILKKVIISHSAGA